MMSARAAGWERNGECELSSSVTAVGVADNRHVGANIADHGKCALQQGPASEFQESLVGAHARALASSQEEPHTRTLPW